MRRLLAGVAGLATLVAVVGVGTASPAASGSWVGRYTLGGGDELALTLSGKQALVALGAGHADLQAVPLSTAERADPIPAAGPTRGGCLRRRDRERKARGHGPPGQPARHVLGATRERRRPRRAWALPLWRHARGRRRRPLRPGPARRSRLGQGARAVSLGHRLRDRLRVRDPRTVDGNGHLRPDVCPDRGQHRQARARPAARGALPQRHRHPRRDALDPARRGKARRRRLRPRVGPDGPGLPPRSLGDAAAARRRRARLRQAGQRPVRRHLSRRIADRRARSTPWRATRRRRRASSPPSRRSIAPASGSRDRARRAGSCPSPPHASRPCASSSSSPARP